MRCVDAGPGASTDRTRWKRGLLPRSPSPYGRRGGPPENYLCGFARASRGIDPLCAGMFPGCLDLSREQMLALADSCRAMNAPLRVKGRTDEFEHT